MNFNNVINFLAAMSCVFVGILYWIVMPTPSPYYGLFTFSLYCLNISLLAKDLQERPKEWTGGTSGSAADKGFNT